MPPADESVALLGIFRISDKRWYLLAILFLLQLSGALQAFMYVSVTETIAAKFHTTAAAIDWLAQEFFAAYVLMAPIVPYCFVKFGLKPTLNASAASVTIGSLIKVFASIQNNGKTVLALHFFGQAFIGLGQVALITCPPLFAAVWFPDSERATANTVGTIADTLAVAVAALVSAAVIDQHDPMNNDLLTLSWVYAIPCVLGTVLMFALFAEKPPTPPSASAESRDKMTFWEGCKRISKNGQFWILVMSFSAGGAAMNAFLTLMQQFLASKGFNNLDASHVTALLVGCGVISAGITGVWVDKSKKFKLAYKATHIIALGSAIFFVFALRSGSLGQIYAAAALLGAATFIGLPSALELGVECTHPVHPGTSTTILWVTTIGVSVVLISVCNALFSSKTDVTKPFSAANAVWFLFGVTVFGVITSQMYTSPNLRMEDESQQSSLRNSGATSPIVKDDTRGSNVSVFSFQEQTELSSVRNSSGSRAPSYSRIMQLPNPTTKNESDL